MAGQRAVVLLNLGAPDRPAAVRPFLRNLFADPAILPLPAPLRRPLAELIAARRAPFARAIYARLGGGSPLLANTRAQAAALERALGGPAAGWRVFVAMRYWHPLIPRTVAEVAAFAPEAVIVLPLYPQFSTTTTGSARHAWARAAARAGLAAPVRWVCCWPTAAGWIAALAEATGRAMDQAAAAAGGRPRVLFSAHGLPKRVVARGDPYPWQVARTARAVAAALGLEAADWRVCYQSRVGPLAWLEPATEAEIRRAAADRVPLVVVPIAFVSEHSETLVELDQEYRTLAEREGVPAFVRVPTVGTGPGFIAALADLVRAAAARPAPLAPGPGEEVCPAACPACPYRAAAARGAA